MIELGICLLSRCATEMWLSGESQVAEVGVRTISAPRARKTITFSALIFSGSTIMVRYPLTAPASARPIPKIAFDARFIIHLMQNQQKKI